MTFYVGRIINKLFSLFELFSVVPKPFADWPDTKLLVLLFLVKKKGEREPIFVRYFHCSCQRRFSWNFKSLEPIMVIMHIVQVR